MLRDGPLMIFGGGSGREFVLSFFFPANQLMSSRASSRFFHAFDRAPQSIMVLPLVQLPQNTATNHGPIMFHTATVSHKRWNPGLL